MKPLEMQGFALLAAGDLQHPDVADAGGLADSTEAGASGDGIADRRAPFGLGLLSGWLLSDFDAIHASPPCQRYSDLAYRNDNADEHPDLIGPVRQLLELASLRGALDSSEHLAGNPRPTAVRPVGELGCLGASGDFDLAGRDGLICGTERNLRVDCYRLRRHRLFETNWPLLTPGCKCWSPLRVPVLDVSGGGPSHAPRKDGAGGRTYKGTADQVRSIMGMPWATKADCNEAVPPAYTELIGHQLMQHISRVPAGSSL